MSDLPLETENSRYVSVRYTRYIDPIEARGSTDLVTLVLLLELVVDLHHFCVGLGLWKIRNSVSKDWEVSRVEVDIAYIDLVPWLRVAVSVPNDVLGVIKQCFSLSTL